MKKNIPYILLAVASLGLMAATLFAGYKHAYYIDFTALEGDDCRPWSHQYGDLTVTVTSDADFSTRIVGKRYTALTTTGKATISFSPPVSQVSAYMNSNPGFEDSPPLVTCYGLLYYTDANGSIAEPVEYQFGPGVLQASFPSTGQSSGGTPVNDEFQWDRCEVESGNFWYFVAIE